EAEPGGLALAKPQVEAANEEPPVQLPLPPAPEVTFSTPTEDETDVASRTNVRIQFSRDIDQATLRGNIHVQYVENNGSAQPVSTTAPEFTTRFNVANRVLEIRFSKPLERFHTVKIDLPDAILGTDHQPLKPWTLTFHLGGS